MTSTIDTTTDTTTNEEITEPHSSDGDITETGGGEGELCWLPVGSLAPHPDNPRSELGDVTELVRSVRSQGVLEPLLVLPASEDETYRIVAGHRRHHAAVQAGLGQVPAVVRDLAPVEVIEAMLSENTNRDDLSLGDEVRAMERLMSLDGGLSPAKLCRRIGKCQAWVRSRMAITVLPSRWRQALDEGTLTLAAAEAAAGAADLGPEHLDALCERLSGRYIPDPGHVVRRYRDQLGREKEYERMVARERRSDWAVFAGEQLPPAGTMRLTELFSPESARAHETEPCHAVVIRPVNYAEGYDRCEVCVEPRRHRPSKVLTGKGSDLAADRYAASGTSGTSDSNRAKRKGRLARLDHATGVWARGRGGVSRGQLTALAQRGLVLSAGLDALAFAGVILGHDKAKDVTAAQLLESADTPTKLARLAGAVACGIAESHMYHRHGSVECREYLRLLCDSGWEPDDWTREVLATQQADGTDPSDGGSGAAWQQGE